VLVPAVSLALAGTLFAALTPGAPGAGPHAAPDRPATGAPHTTGARAAAVTLGRIADASLRTGAVTVHDSQFVYVRSLVRSNTGALGGPVKLGAPHPREVWMAQDPAPVTVLGWIRETGKGVPMSGQDIPIETAAPDGSDDTGALPPGADRPTYRWLAGLPTDPDALLALLRERVGTPETGSADQAVFERIGSLLDETIMPPRNAAALYRAAARLPGVRVVPDAVDAAGRHGIGISREDPALATRNEWIFDRDSLAYLGSRGYLAEGGRRGAPKVLANSNAVLGRAVVDQRGMTPQDDGGATARG
jgi:hypothetical protein